MVPPLDYVLSPYTGWTRAHWEMMLARATHGYVLASARLGSPARALFPDDRAERPDAVDALEAFSRLALPWGSWLRNPANPAVLCFDGKAINLETLMRQALLEGTNRANPFTYWGDVEHMDQRIVEIANISIALWLSHGRVFDR